MSPKKNFDDQDMWVDFLEDELDESLKDDLKKMLEHSPEARESLEELKGLRRAIKSSSEDIKVPEDPAYYAEKHDAIMSGIKKSKVQSPVVVKLFQEKTLRVAAAVALIIVSGGIIWESLQMTDKSPQPAGVEMAKSSQWFLESTARNPEVVPQTVITHEGEIDIYMDATAEKLESMSDKEAKDLMQRLSK